MEGQSGMFVTEQYVRAAHGAAVRDFPFIACSDKPFTEVGVCLCVSSSFSL